MGQIDWQQSAKKLDCLIRGLISWPGACTRFRGKNLKIWEEEVASKEALTLSGVTMEGDGASVPGPAAHMLDAHVMDARQLQDPLRRLRSRQAAPAPDYPEDSVRTADCGIL